MIDGDFHAMPGCSIDPSAKVTGKSSLGSNVIVAKGAVIDDCIVGDNVRIEEDVRLSHCFIFHDTIIGAGVQKECHYLSSAITEPINLS